MYVIYDGTCLDMEERDKNTCMMIDNYNPTLGPTMVHAYIIEDRKDKEACVIINNHMHELWSIYDST